MNALGAALIGVDAGLALATAAGGIALWALLRQLNAWSHAALDLGLRLETRGLVGVGVMRGVLDGVPIAVEEDRDSVLTRIEIDGWGRWPGGVSIAAPAAFGERQLAEANAPVIDTEVPAFDAELRVRGQPAAALAMLGRDARRILRDRMRRLRPHGWVLLTPPGASAVIRLERKGRIHDAGQLVDAVRGLRAMALAMSLGDRSLEQALADNARDDIAPLRRRHLAMLVELGEPGSGVVRTACRRGLADADTRVRLIAASALGLEGIPVLDEILLDDAKDASLRLEALRLRLRAPSEDVGSVLVRVLASPCPPLRIEAMAAIGARRWAPALERLVKLAESIPAEGEEAIALAGALGAIGDASAEPSLLRFVASEQLELRLAALRALAGIGTIAAVEDLMAIAEGLLQRPALRSAAREALRSIRSRLGPADAGRLSLVSLDGGAGALSMARDAAGQVTLDAGPAPRANEVP